MSEPRFHLVWTKPRLVRVTCARNFRLPALVRNTYPGAWIGVCLYWHHKGLSFMWGKPGGIRA